MQTEDEIEDTDEDVEETEETIESSIEDDEEQEEIVAPEEDEDFSIALLTPEERESRRTQNRPDISWLSSAVVDGKFTLKKGDFLVMERKLLTQESRPWLDTKCYEIISEPTEDGNMRLLECIRRCNALLNWKTAIDYGYVLACPPKGRNPETLFQSHGKRRRKKRFVQPKEPTENSSTTQVVSTDSNNPQKRGRGRPKGSKNRPSEEVAKAKAEYRQHLREKRERRRK